jgi:hypothetical protein
LLNNGALFMGYKNSQGKMDGPGIFIWWDRAKYEGSFKDNMRSGYGEIKYTNGDVYEGQWENDYPNGQGVMRYYSGDVFEGSWLNGLQNGLGVLRQ